MRLIEAQRWSPPLETKASISTTREAAYCLGLFADRSADFFSRKGENLRVASSVAALEDSEFREGLELLQVLGLFRRSDYQPAPRLPREDEERVEELKARQPRSEAQSVRAEKKAF